MPETPKTQKKYNASEKGKKARAKYNKINRAWLEEKRGDRRGTCSFCGEFKWLARKSEPTICPNCLRKQKKLNS